MLAHWGIVRLCRCSYIGEATVPSIRCLNAGRIFLGWNPAQQPVFVDMMDEDIVSRAMNNPGWVVRPFLVVGREEITLFVAAPDGELPVLQVIWDNVDVHAIVQMSDKTAPYSLAPSQMQTIPVKSFQFPIPVPQNDPLPSRNNYLCVWLSLMVRTHIVFPGLHHRIEHYSSGRVPRRDCAAVWIKQVNGGYSLEPEDVVRRQATAALTWTTAVRVALTRAGWVERLAWMQKQLHLMGFEANNPFHDDHTGKGAHFHVTVKNCGCMPHIYLDPTGNIRTPGEKWIAGPFVVVVDSERVLRIQPSMTLQSTRNGMFVHIRQSCQKLNDAAVQWNDVQSDGSVFALEHSNNNNPNEFSIASMRSNRQLCAFGTEDRTPIFQGEEILFNSSLRASMGIWAAQVNPDNVTHRVINKETGKAFHVRQLLQNLRDPVVQFAAEDGGSIWSMNAPLLGQSFAFRYVNENHIEVERNGVLWLRVLVAYNNVIGQIIVTTVCGNEEHTEILRYDKLTGVQIG